jgi:YesN/AraC family two-component response regulator
MIHLLIVDDEKEIREMLARHFRLNDYVVHMAENGRLAIEVLERERIDILITDLLMPEMSGIELLEYVREEAPMIHAIAITGYVTLENALSCMRLGADTIVFKPLEDLSELETAVQAAEKDLLLWQTKLRELRGMRH